MDIHIYMLLAVAVLGISALHYQSWKRLQVLRRKSRVLQTLYTIGNAMTSTLEYDALLHQIMDISRTTIGAETASVVLADEQSGDLVLVCSHGLPADVKPGMRSPADQGVSGWVFTNAKPVMLHGSQINDPRFQHQHERAHIRSALSVPLVGKQKPVGVLSLNNSTRRQAFTSEDLDLLSAIGTQAGIAVENARLHRKVEEAKEHLTVTVEHLRNLKSALTSITALGFEESIDLILDAAMEGSGAISGWFTVINQNNTVHHVAASYDREGLKLDISQEADDVAIITPNSKDFQAAVSSPSHSIIQVLTAQEQVIGLLRLIADPNQPGFDHDDHEFVDALVEHASTVVLNNLLYQEAEAGRTALQQAYEELQDKQDQLVRSEKLAAIGKLAAWVCHEINNPLGAISGCAQLMKRKIEGIEKTDPNYCGYEKYLSTIISETERCARITGNLLQFSRQQEPSFSQTDLHSILSNTISLLQFKYPTKFQITTDFDQQVPTVAADSQQLTQVFLNLLTNAAEAMPEGGLLEIRTRYSPGNNDLTGEVHIWIRDSGPGVNQEEVAHLFEPFYTTKQTGTGLGLAISKSIIDNHYGSLQLINADGRGAVAEIVLPVSHTKKMRKQSQAGTTANTSTVLHYN